MAATRMIIPSETLNNNTKIPILGIPSWGWSENEPGSVTEVVKCAIDLGYRYIDTKPGQNEVEVGEAISAKIKEGVVKREELFLVGNLMDTKALHNPELIMPALLSTLRNLNVAYVDLYVVSCPDVNHTLNDDDLVQMWYQMEKLVDNFLVKSIGLSNFDKKHIEHLLIGARFCPVTNQLECHPDFKQLGITDFCITKHIPITAYNIYGSKELMEDPLIVSLGKKYNKTPQQILLRYQIDKGHIAVPSLQSISDLRNNLEVFKFKLNESDVVAMDKLDHVKKSIF